MDHALAFRVMRLSKSGLQPTSNTLLDMELDFLSDSRAAEALHQRRASSVQATTSGRTHLSSPVDICNISGMLELPTAFGSLFLGEAFQSYVSVINVSRQVVNAVTCKAELESSRGRVTLYDNSAQRVNLQPGSRHDFIIRHDVKEVGQHTLTCSAAYTLPDGERRVLPQNFKFTSSNPLSVRTKSRRVHDIILLEACIENTSRSPMVLDYLRFDPHPQMSAIEICTDPPDPGKGSPGQHLADYIQNLKVITPLGGALNLVFQLSPVQQEDSAKLADGTAGGVLGKLDIKWRTTFGDVGRLQTQPISAPAAALKDVKLQVMKTPLAAHVGLPFNVTVLIASNTDRRWHDLHVGCRKDASTEHVICLGPARVALPELGPAASTEVDLQFLALENGVLALPEILLTEGERQTLIDAAALSVKVE